MEGDGDVPRVDPAGGWDGGIGLENHRVMGIAYCAADREGFRDREVDELNDGSEWVRLGRSLKLAIVNGGA